MNVGRSSSIRNREKGMSFFGKQAKSKFGQDEPVMENQKVHRSGSISDFN